MIKKNYQIKVYGVDGAFKRTISPSIIMNTISFDSQINGGQGELSLNLNVSIDNNRFEMGDFVKVFCFDESHIDGRILYTGSVSRILREFSKTGEYIQLKCIGLFAFMNRIFFKSGSNYVFNKTQDPGTTIIEMITYFNSIYTGTEILSSGIDLFGSDISLDFNYTKCNDVLKNIQAVTRKFYYYIGADGVAEYKENFVDATNHRLKIANQIDDINIEETVETVGNSIFVGYSEVVEGPIEDSESITKYGKIEKKISSSTITDTAGATIYGTQYLDANKDESKQITITINSKYDIESIKPGHTLTILNTDYTFGTLQVQKIRYTPDSIVVNVNKYETFAQSVLSDNS